MWWNSSTEVLERFVVLLMVLASVPLVAAQGDCGPPPPPQPDTQADCANTDPLRQPFFGDLHAHTSSSLDADLQGTRLGPDSAYDFARGVQVDIQPYDANGDGLRTLTIDRPLDFAMVADHAEFFGEISICRAATQPNPGSLCDFYQNYPETAFLLFNLGLSFSPPDLKHNPTVCGTDGQLCVDESITLWNEIQDAAENAYDRTSACSFTSFVGYEWTGSPNARNLHRNVVFRSATVPTRATSYFEAPYPEALWDSLEADCNAPDCEFLTIPHNSNLSSGIYFDLIDRDGNPYTDEVARRRGIHEPLIEVMQHKGQAECIPESSPQDELCNFELLSFSTLAGPGIVSGGPPKPRDFVREALKEGIALKRSLGENPFKHGMIGSTDTHLATPGAVAEDNYPGHGGAGAPARDEIPPGLVDKPYYNPGGLAVIWAEENSRDSLFDAMRRKEVYATSGTRPVVRFFGGFDLAGAGDLCTSQTAIQDAYDNGVPMGGDLGAPNGSPTFFVDALKDPLGSDLQRVQVVKLWVDGNGDKHELVYDVAGDPNNGASVDLNTCQPVGTGSSELCTMWQDPAFDPDEHATYYVRVIENPTCRWHKRQCNAGGVDCTDPQTITEGFEECCPLTTAQCDAAEVDCDDPTTVPLGMERCCFPLPDTIQERAWTSPIWYSPPTTPPPAATVLDQGDIVMLLTNPTQTGGGEIARLLDDGSTETLFAFPDVLPFKPFRMAIADRDTVIVLGRDAAALEVYEIDLAGQTLTVVGTLIDTGAHAPHIAVEPDGHVLVSMAQDGKAVLKRVDRISGAVTTAWTDTVESNGLSMFSLDPEGSVAAVRTTGVLDAEIIKIDLATGQSPIIYSGVPSSAGMAVDLLDGKVFASTPSLDGDVIKIDPDAFEVSVIVEDSPFHSQGPPAMLRDGIKTTDLVYAIYGAYRLDLSTGVLEIIYASGSKVAWALSVVHPACSDGIDNDGDSAVDFPADSMCANQLDDNE